MRKLKYPYRLTTILLLTLILSHTLFFHFELKQKVLCVGEDEHIHIEKIIDSLISNDLLVDNDTIRVISTECTDFRLDHHVDEDFVKTKKINFNKLKIVVKINHDTYIKNEFLRSKNQTYKYTNNTPLDSFSTISLLI